MEDILNQVTRTSAALVDLLYPIHIRYGNTAQRRLLVIAKSPTLNHIHFFMKEMVADGLVDSSILAAITNQSLKTMEFLNCGGTLYAKI